MLKLSVLILLVALTFRASPSHAASRWPRRQAQASDSGMYNDIEFVPYEEQPSRNADDPRIFRQLSAHEDVKNSDGTLADLDEKALQARLSDIFDNLAVRVLEETEPSDRYEVAVMLSDGAKHKWSSIKEFLHYWSKMIAELQKRKAEKDKQYHRNRSEEFDLNMIE